MRFIFVFLVNGYQKLNGFLSGLGIVKPACVFYPSCSQYAKEAFKKYGVLKGLYLSFRRIFRCHPWQKKYFDPV